jgi:nucleoside-diphosphate-sugar epimerase
VRVFVAGATGVLGRRAVVQLVAAGHRVTAVARSPEKAAGVRAAGAEPVTVDLFDPAAVAAAVAGHDVVVNLATHIPPPAQAAVRSAWAESDRLRHEASRHLVDAALATGAGRVVQESIAFLYPDSGDRWIDEDVPLDVPELGRANEAAEHQARRFGEGGGVAVVLRFGRFYAPDAAHTVDAARTVLGGRSATLGPLDAYAPVVASDDAATAVAAALRAPAGTWNVTDDHPLPRRELDRAMAGALGVEPPPATDEPPPGLSPGLRFFLRSQRVANRRFRDATGWAPVHADAAAGWRAMAPDLRRAIAGPAAG